ncbi:MAG: ABC transporter permease subunit [Clostridia bacterium]|nr:ABC transporter permease subunit [Clostridia bacterium]
MLAIYKKELHSFFINPIGYVFCGVFLTLAAGLCCYTTLISASYSTNSYFYIMILCLIVLIPILTMRSFSEERKMRTEQMLLTAPVSIIGMVVGKFLAAYTVFAGCLLTSCVNLIPLFVIGKAEADLNQDAITHIGPVGAQIVASLVGVLLIGGAFIAIGIFVSSLTENQLSAVIISIAVLAVMVLLNVVNQIGSDSSGTRLINSYVVRFIIDWFCILSRFSNFQYGILDWSAFLYYISLSFIFVYLTVRVYERRRWA